MWSLEKTDLYDSQQIVKESATRHEFQIVLSLFPALQHLSQLRPEYEQLMEGK